MFLIDTKNDGFGHAVGGFQEVDEMLGDCLGALLERHQALEIPRVILVVGNLTAMPIQSASIGPPAGGVEAGDNSMDSIRGQESVFNALAERVRVDRIAKIG